MKKIIIVIVFSLLFISNSNAGEDVKKEIIQRCRSQMGEYGATMVKACVDQDIEALIAINKYLDKYKSIVMRCYGQMKEYGYTMIKACADQDIEAEKALSNY